MTLSDGTEIATLRSVYDAKGQLAQQISTEATSLRTDLLLLKARNDTGLSGMEAELTALHRELTAYDRKTDGWRGALEVRMQHLEGYWRPAPGRLFLLLLAAAVLGGAVTGTVLHFLR